MRQPHPRASREQIAQIFFEEFERQGSPMEHISILMQSDGALQVFGTWRGFTRMMVVETLPSPLRYHVRSIHP